jgi:hypothetical protein
LWFSPLGHHIEFFTPFGPAIDATQAEHSRVALLDFIDRLPASHGLNRPDAHRADHLP